MDSRRMKIAIIERGITQKDLCSRIGMTEGTFIRKIRQNSFTLHEAETIAHELQSNPCDIFFTQSDTCQVPR